VDRFWRDEPATDQQKRRADALGIKYPPHITRGDLADLIIPQSVPQRRWYEVSFRQRLMWAAVTAVLLVVLLMLQWPWYEIVIVLCGIGVLAVVGRINVHNWFLGFVITSCVLLVTGYSYPPSNPLTSSQAAVLWSVIGEVFFLRLLGFRTTQIVIPLAVVLGMIFIADCAVVSPHSALAPVYGLGFNTICFAGAVIVAEVIGRCLGR
jgi:hypothetical protein